MMHMTPELLERMAKQRVLKLAEALAQEFLAFYPKRCKILTKPRLKAFTERCALDAYGYGAENYGELKSYAYIAWHLGVGFAHDPFYASLGTLFTTDLPFSSKIEEATAYFFQNFNPEEKDYIITYNQALHRLLKLDFKKLSRLQNYTHIAKVLEAVYPQRVEKLGGVEHISNALALSCEGKIMRYNIQHPIGIFTYGTLCFFLGSDIDTDPLYPWAEKYLNDPEPKMAYKVDRLIKVIRKRVKKENIRLETMQKEIDHG